MLLLLLPHFGLNYINKDLNVRMKDYGSLTEMVCHIVHMWFFSASQKPPLVFLTACGHFGTNNCRNEALHLSKINQIYHATSSSILVHVNGRDEKIGGNLFQPPLKENWYLCRLSVLWTHLKEDFCSWDESWLCFPFEKDTFFLKRKEKTFHFSITPSSLTSPILPRSSFHREEKKRRDAFHLHGSTPPSHSSPIILATTFMHETER